MLIWLYLSDFSLDAVKSVIFHLESVVMCVCTCVYVLETHSLYRLKAFPIFISVVSVSSGMGKN